MSEHGAQDVIKNKEQFDDTPEGWQKRWEVELAAAEEAVKDFHKDGKAAVESFLVKDRTGKPSVLALFTANVQTLRAMLYGKTPKVDVSRRWGDPEDDVGRVAAEMLQRLLNTDIQRDSNTYARALKHALIDNMLTGLGMARVRYVANFKKVKVEPKYKTNEAGEQIKDASGNPIQLVDGYEEDQKTFEDAVVDFVHWDDVLWSSGSRIFEEWRWCAFRCPMTQDELVERFADKLDEDHAKGVEQAKEIPLNSKDNPTRDPKMAGRNPWMMADVWEIWDKANRKVWWVVKGCPKVLDDQPDPYELEGFFPFPEPLAANLSTDAYMPRSDYAIAEDIYNEINTLSSRIALLEKAVRCAGLYNGNSDEVKRLLSEAGLNELIGVENWREFSDSGGIEGNISWFPLEPVAKAIALLEQQRQAKIALLYQVTGMSDIMRGQSNAPATATEQALKAKFASVRVQERQEEFARFASDLQKLVAELMLKFFSDENITKRSNIMFTADQNIVPQALQLLRDQFVSYRIEVKPESVSATDYAALQQERTQVMQGVTQFFQAAMPVTQAMPELVPDLFQMLKWMFAGFRGSSTIERVLDNMAMKAEKKIQQMVMQPPPPDPQLEATKVQAQADIQKTKLDMQHTVLEHQTKMREAQVKERSAVMQDQLDQRRMEREVVRDSLQSVNGAVPGNGDVK